MSDTEQQGQQADERPPIIEQYDLEEWVTERLRSAVHPEAGSLVYVLINWWWYDTWALALEQHGAAVLPAFWTAAGDRDIVPHDLAVDARDPQALEQWLDAVRDTPQGEDVPPIPHEAEHGRVRFRNGGSDLPAIESDGTDAPTVIAQWLRERQEVELMRAHSITTRADAWEAAGRPEGSGP